MSPALPRCQSCASDNVLRDAWARWDAQAGCWEIAALFDHTICEDCGATVVIGADRSDHAAEAHP